MYSWMIVESAIFQRYHFWLVISYDFSLKEKKWILEDLVLKLRQNNQNFNV